MNNYQPILRRSKFAALALAIGLLGVVPAALPQQLTIATDPLGTSSTSIKPNLMFILDDSGSMASDFLPDWVIDTHNPISSTASCFDSGDTAAGGGGGGGFGGGADFDDAAGKISGNPDGCQVGDPPYMSSDMNTIYYNPAITYRPAINYDGTSRGAQDAAATTNWTAVRTDSYNVDNKDQLGASTNFANIATNYPDRVWCTSTAAAANSGACRVNGSYDYPNAQFAYGRDAAGAIKRISTNPYFYTMRSTQYCNPAGGGTNCKSGSSIDPLVQTARFVEYCTDSELTTCAAGAAVTAAHTFSGVRWCSDATTLATCQRKKIGNFVYAKHLGRTVPQTGSFAAIANQGTINVTGVVAAGGTITGITIGVTTVFSGSLAIPAGTTVSGAATIIQGAIGSGYTAVASGSSVTVTQVTAGSAGSGAAISVTAAIAPTARAAGSITVSKINKAQTITAVSVNGVNLLCTAGPLPTTATGNGVNVNASGYIVGSSGFNNNNSRDDAKNAIAARINACTAVNGGYTATANASTGKVDIFAPLSAGATPNGYVVSLTGVPATAVNMAGGASGPSITTSTVSMSGGADAFTGTYDLRIGVGEFKRFDILPSNNSYTKVPGRTDCLSSTCTYAEEMTNFANWYTYYRNRIRMIKSSAGLAFANVDSNYRVGFITINPGSPVSSGKYLKISDFTSGPGGQRDLWYTKFYGQNVGQSTPLRESLSRVGWIFAGKLNTGLTNGIPVADDPVTSSCQPNFAIQSTDGYWNGNGGQQLDGTAMDNRDGNPSLTPRPMYDGSATTLTDVTVTKTYTMGAVNGSGCSGGKKRILLATATVTRTRIYNSSDTTGSPVSDVTSTNTVNSNFTGCSANPGALPSPNPVVTVNPQTVAFATGAANTLADVTAYYYNNDLRTPTGMTWAPNGTGWPAGISDNNVPITNKDTNSAQHMVTFTIGLGLDGTLTYRPDYETATSGDFYNITQGTANWPVPVADAPTALDDLWHAAVNGHGVFFSARDPQSLSNSLIDTLVALGTRVGAGAAAATSNLQPVAGDNFAFTAQYQTSDWIGDLSARTIDLTTGIVSGVQLWSAQALLDGVAHTSRTIFTYDGTDTLGNRLKHFCMPTDVGASWCNDGAGLTPGAGGEQSYFSPSGLAQYPYSNDAAKLATVSTDKVVNFLRGDNSYEDTGLNASTDLFRQRTTLLGDIVNAQPAYVRKSPFVYADAGYAGFKNCTEGVGTGCAAAQFPNPSQARRGTVYAAANDGMLHAFETDVNNNPYYQTAGVATAIISDDTFAGNNAGNGMERWAYIPGTLLPSLRQLANIPYSHHYFTDGSPAVGDFCLAPCATQNDWRTMLVAGFNDGGIGFYALDITNPFAPKALWELRNAGVCYTQAQIDVGDKTSDCNLGLSYGNPIITKRADGTWVVIVTSGYNNNVGGGDGGGYLYVIEAATGKILHRIATGTGSAAAPSGLSKINGFSANSSLNNTTLAVYGGDLGGNMWRFQLDPTDADYLRATKVAAAVSSSATGSKPQPITVKPELALIGGRRLILFGTGKFLETADKGDTSSQSIYALFDNLNVTSGTVIGNVRDGSVAVRVLVDNSGVLADTRTISSSSAAVAVGPNGWLIDLPEIGERVNVDPQLQLGTLVVASNVPTGGTCVAGGFSFINFLDVATGLPVVGASGNMASSKIASSLTVGINIIQLPGGAVKTIATTADNQQLSKDTPVPTSSFGGRRISWRELIKE